MPLTDALQDLRAGRLAGVRELKLPGCGLIEVPSEIFALADTLEVLDLSGNGLKLLPDDFNRLTQLKVLFASGNPFDTMPPVLWRLSQSQSDRPSRLRSPRNLSRGAAPAASLADRDR